MTGRRSRSRRPGGNPAAAFERDDVGRRLAHHGKREERRGRRTKRTIVVERARPEQAGAGACLGDRGFIRRSSPGSRCHRHSRKKAAPVTEPKRRPRHDVHATRVVRQPSSCGSQPHAAVARPDRRQGPATCASYAIKPEEPIARIGHDLLRPAKQRRQRYGRGSGACRCAAARQGRRSDASMSMHTRSGNPELTKHASMSASCSRESTMSVTR